MSRALGSDPTNMERWTSDKIKTIACLGAGYVGGPTMAVIAKCCPHIKCIVVDVNESRINAWNSDKLPIYEPGLQAIVAQRINKNLFFTTDVASAVQEAELIFIAVNTPTKETGAHLSCGYDLSAYESAALMIAQHATHSVIVVEKSTVPVRTAERLRFVLECNRTKPSIKFEILSNPEFLAEGTAINDLLYPDRILIGGRQTPSGIAAVRALASVYEHWVPKEKIITTGLWSAELAKLASNAFLAQRISSINSFSVICEQVGANVQEVAKVVGSDHRIGSEFLRASIGFGGSCFTKDLLGLIYLAESYHLTEVADYWRQVLKMNSYQKERFCKLLVDKLFGTLAKKNICLFGFAFKKDTGDIRGSAAIDVANFLLSENANVSVYDPKAPASEIKKIDERIRCERDPYTAAYEAHAVLVLTEWDEFKQLDWSRIYADMQKPAFVFDGRNILDYDLLVSEGFVVHRIGHPFLGPDYKRLEQ